MIQISTCIIPRLGAWIIKFLPRKNVEYCFRTLKVISILKVIKALFYYRKNVRVVGIVYNSGRNNLLIFGSCACFKNSKGISLPPNLLSSFSDLGYFCSSNVFFQLFKAFFFYIFIFNNDTHSSCKREGYIC